MARLDPSHAAQTVLPAALGDVLSPDLLVRHGACLAVAEVTLALGQVLYIRSGCIFKGKETFTANGTRFLVLVLVPRFCFVFGFGFCACSFFLFLSFSQ